MKNLLKIAVVYCALAALLCSCQDDDPGGKNSENGDPSSWTLIKDHPFDDDIYAIAWGKDKFVVGSFRGKMAYWSGELK